MGRISTKSVIDKVEFQWNDTHSVIIGQLGFGKALNKECATICARYFNEFVPYLSGNLSRRVQTFGAKDHGTITYQAPYANRQYTGTWEHCKDFHPLATSYWDKAGWAAHKREIVNDINKKRREYAKK